MFESKIFNFLLRIVFVFFAIWFVSLDKNPLVVLEAQLGLSPSPLERLFHVKGIFSGMTEGMFQLAHGNIIGAMSANILTPIVAIAFFVLALGGYRPQIQTKKQEAVFLLSVIFLSLMVNLINS